MAALLAVSVMPAHAAHGPHGGHDGHHKKELLVDGVSLCARLGVTATSPRTDVRDGLLEQVVKGGTAVEIGVWRGHFALTALSILKPTKYILLDPWAFQETRPGRWYGPKAKAAPSKAGDIKSQADMDAVYEGVVRDVVTPNAGRVEVIRKFSWDAIFDFEHASVDFVYVDGDHNKYPTLTDILGFWPALRKGGLMAGDDLEWGPDLDGSPLPVLGAIERALHILGPCAENLGSCRSQWLLRKTC